MAVHIRLSRAGTKKRPFYRVMVTDHRSPNGGKFLENIGTYDPREKVGEGKEPAVKLDAARLAYWRSKGAQMSDTVDRLVKNLPAVEAAAK